MLVSSKFISEQDAKHCIERGGGGGGSVYRAFREGGEMVLVEVAGKLPCTSLAQRTQNITILSLPHMTALMPTSASADAIHE